MYHYQKFLCLTVIALVIKQSSQSPVGSKAQEGSLDLKVDLSCIANVTCVNNVSNKVVRALNLRKVVDLGLFTIEPVLGAKATEGRSMSKFWEFASSNALRIPLGAYSLSLQKSEEYQNYLEIAVSKTEEGVFRCAVESFQRTD